MAFGRRVVCTICARDFFAWDAGDPYYLNEAGRKIYPALPSAELHRCDETDTAILCLNCGTDGVSDSAVPATQCRRCGSSEIHGTGDLEGRPGRPR